MVILISQNKITDFFYDFSPGHVPLTLLLLNKPLQRGIIFVQIMETKGFFN